MNSPLNEIFKSLTSLKEELTNQNKENLKQKNLEKVKQFLLEKQMLNEISVQDAYIKIYKDIPKNEFDEIIAADPFTKTNFLSPYSKWMLKRYKEGHIKLEDLEAATEYIQTHNRYKDKYKNVDWYKLYTLADLYNIVKDDIAYSQAKTGTVNLCQPIDGSEKFYEDSKWCIIVPKTEYTACYYGRNTEWCTAWGEMSFDERHKGKTNRFRDHSKGPLYIIINKNNQDEKYQFHFASGQFMNVNDKQLPKESEIFNELLKLFLQNKKFFSTLSNQAKIQFLSNILGNYVNSDNFITTTDLYNEFFNMNHESKNNEILSRETLMSLLSNKNLTKDEAEKIIKNIQFTINFSERYNSDDAVYTEKLIKKIIYSNNRNIIFGIIPKKILFNIINDFDIEYDNEDPYDNGVYYLKITNIPKNEYADFIVKSINYIGKEYVLQLSQMTVKLIIENASDNNNRQIIFDTLIKVGGLEFIYNTLFKNYDKDYDLDGDLITDFNLKHFIDINKFIEDIYKLGGDFTKYDFWSGTILDSEDPEKTINLIGDKAKDYIQKWFESMEKHGNDYNKLASISNYPEAVKKFFQKYGKLPKDDSTTPLNEIFKSLTSLKEELTNQNKENLKQKNLEKVKQFLLEKQMLNEISIQDAYTKFYNDIPQEEFDEIVKADPFTKTNFLSPYAKWLLKIYKNNNLRLEDLQAATEYIQTHNRYKDNYKNLDWNKLNTLADLYNVIKDDIAYSQAKTGTVNLCQPIDGSIKFYEDSKWCIIVPKTEYTACYYGRNTEWCTAWGEMSFDERHKGKTNRFRDHSKGPLYIIINKNNQDEKYQFHFASVQFKDINDNEMSRNNETFNELLNIFLSNDKFIQNLTSEEIYNLLNMTKNINKLFNILIKTFGKDLMKKLKSYGINALFSNSKEPYKLFNTLIKMYGKDFINEWDFAELNKLLENSETANSVFQTMLSIGNLDFILKLNSLNIYNLIKSNDFSDNIINTILNILIKAGKKVFRNKISEERALIRVLLMYSSEPDKIIKILDKYGNNCGTNYIQSLIDASTYHIYIFLSESKEFDKLLNLVINIDASFLKLNKTEGSFYIKKIIARSKEPEKIRELFKKYNSTTPLNENVKKRNLEKVKQFLLEKQMLNEISVQDGYTKFYNDIPQEEFNEIISADPFTKTNFLSPYAKWLLKIYKNNNLRLEDLQAATEYIQTHNRYKDNYKNLDWNKLNTLADLYNIVKDDIAYSQAKTGTVNLCEPIDGSEKIYEDSKWCIIIPKTEYAACYYGRNTEWCTAWGKMSFDERHKGKSNRFHDHSQGPLYIIINKNNQNEKYQFHFETNQFKYVNDSEIPKYSEIFKELFNLLLQNKKFIMNLDSKGIENLLKYSSDPEKLFNLLPENQRKKFIMNLDSDEIENLLYYSSKRDKIINLLNKYGDNKGTNFIMNLDSNRIKSLLKYSSEFDKVFNLLPENQRKEFIMNLDSDGIINLFYNSSQEKRDKAIDTLFNIGGKEFIMNLNSESIKNLLTYSSEPEKVFNLLPENKRKVFIMKLHSYEIENLLKFSPQPEKVFNLLPENQRKNFIMGLNVDEIYNLLYYSAKDKKIALYKFLIDMLFNKGGKAFIMNLDSESIKNLLKFSLQPEKVFNLLGNKGKEFIMDLNVDKIYNLLYYSLEPDKVLNLLGNKGKEFIMDFNSNGIFTLLFYSSKEKRDKIINVLFNIGGKEFIMKLDSDEIKTLLHYSSQPEKMKQILQQYGKLPKDESNTPLNENVKKRNLKKVKQFLLEKQLLTEKDNRQFIVNKLGLPQEVADYAHRISDKYSIWIANAIKTDMENYDLTFDNNFRLSIDENVRRIIEMFKDDNRPKIDYKNLNFSNGEQLYHMYNYIKDWRDNPETPSINLKNMSWDEAENLSREWHESLGAGGRVSDILDEKDKIIHKFSNGFYWVLREDSYCEKSKASMGHCANASSRDMYLFRLIKNDEEYITADWHPTNRYVIQIKGKTNSKPKKDYYPYILWLIADSGYIDELKTDTGYRPETNFHLEDLDENQINYVANKNFKVFANSIVKLSKSTDKNDQKRFYSMLIKNSDNLLSSISDKNFTKLIADSPNPFKTTKILIKINKKAFIEKINSDIVFNIISEITNKWNYVFSRLEKNAPIAISIIKNYFEVLFSEGGKDFLLKIINEGKLKTLIYLTDKELIKKDKKNTIIKFSDNLLKFGGKEVANALIQEEKNSELDAILFRLGSSLGPFILKLFDYIDLNNLKINALHQIFITIATVLDKNKFPFKIGFKIIEKILQKGGKEYFYNSGIYNIQDFLYDVYFGQSYLTKENKRDFYILFKKYDIFQENEYALQRYLTESVLLTEKDNREIIVKKLGLPQEVADFAHNISDKYSLWIANNIMKGLNDEYYSYNFYNLNRNARPPKELNGKEIVALLTGDWEETYRRIIEMFKDDNRPPLDIKNLDLDDARDYEENYSYIKDWRDNPNTPTLNLRNMTWDEAERLSTEWHESLQASGKVSYILDDKDEIIHEFNDGFYWVLRKDYYCEKSEESMGHCATATYKGMYLFRLIKNDEEFITADWHPIDRYIIQIKGKKNSKPKEEYYPYIIWLIADSGYIDELKTYNNGHNPETNFHLSDLNKEELEYVSIKNTNLVTNTLFEQDAFGYFKEFKNISEENRDNIIFNNLLKNKDFINNLDYYKLYNLLKLSSDPEKFIDILNNYNNDKIIRLIKRLVFDTDYNISTDKRDKILNIFFNVIDKKYIMDLFIESDGPNSNYNKLIHSGDNAISKILDIGGQDLIVRLTRDSFRLGPSNRNSLKDLLTWSKDKDNIINKLLNIGGQDFINTLDDVDVKNMLNSSSNPEQLKKAFQQYGKLPKDESNTPMNEIFKSLTSLQEELTEQRKLTIKESNLMKVQNFIKKRKNNQ